MKLERPFHLSIGVSSIEDSVNFFENILKSEVLHRDPSGYVNIDFYGSQVTLKEIPNIKPELPELHFGVNLSLVEFDRLAAHIHQSGYYNKMTKPEIVDQGTPMERKKMYVKCPTGYLFEIKGYK